MSALARESSFLLVTIVVVATQAATPPATADHGANPVKHPNLLLNRDEIAQIRRKIQTHPWAAALLEKLKAGADGLIMDRGDAARNSALLYVLTGEKKYADSARSRLLNEARYQLPRFEKADLKVEPEMGWFSPWGMEAWAYDLTYETFSPQERELVERWLRTACRVVIEGMKSSSTTPNLIFGTHFNVGLVGYCLGDQRLIEWALRHDGGKFGPNKGGFYPVIDNMIKDRYFWGETPIYALHYDVHGMLALAEAALHYDGTDLYGYVSKTSGGSIKGLIDGYLRMAYPLERTGVGNGSIRMATYGDGSTSFSPDGTLFETYLVNPISNSERMPVLAGELELAYKRYRDPAYAWLISLNPARDTYISYGRAALGLIALTHGEVLPEKSTPPSAPSGVYASQGFTMLRADESPEYWRSGSLTAMMMLGNLVGHGHRDHYSLVLHGKGRLLYPDLNVIQYEPTHLNWTREGIAHSTLLVDRQSPTPAPFTTKQEFLGPVKFFAITGSPYAGVKQTRAALVTREYLADFFHAADLSSPARQRVYDWTLHGLGRLYMGNPAAYRPTHDLVPFYWWIDNERGRATDATFQADWIQRSEGATPGLQAFGKEWFDHEVGVRMTMVGEPATRVYAGDGPMCDGPPYHRIDGNPEGTLPMLVVRREAAATTFAAIHEPYEGRPRIKEVTKFGDDGGAMAITVRTPEFTDYLCAAFDEAEHTIRSADGQTIAFRDFAYIRLEGQKATVCGKVSRVPKPSQMSAGQAPASERTASVHTWFSPEEVHLSAGGQREVQLHLRCVGAGQAKGQFRVTAPAGLRVEPAVATIPQMDEGQERIVTLKISADKNASRALREIRLVPEDGLPAAPATLLASVGVVITEDRLRPMNSQYVIRAPGYTMKVDHTSGVSFYLLDADGHRRHGRIHNTNFIYGIPGIQQDGKWAYRFGMPCQFVWTGDDTLTIGCGSPYPDVSLRMAYRFYEDRIVISIIPPTNPTKEQTMWLGNFDALRRPLHNGKQEADHLPIVADRFFFPHPVYRQGLLLTTPPQTPLMFRGSAVNFPIRCGQEITLRFAEQLELPR